MKRSKFTDEQILAIVKEGEAGRKVEDVCELCCHSAAAVPSCRPFGPTLSHVTHTDWPGSIARCQS